MRHVETNIQSRTIRTQQNLKRTGSKHLAATRVKRVMNKATADTEALAISPHTPMHLGLERNCLLSLDAAEGHQDRSAGSGNCTVWLNGISDSRSTLNGQSTTGAIEQSAFYMLIASAYELTGHLITYALSEPGDPKQRLDRDNLAQEMTKTNNKTTVLSSQRPTVIFHFVKP